MHSEFQHLCLKVQQDQGSRAVTCFAAVAHDGLIVHSDFIIYMIE